MRDVLVKNILKNYGSEVELVSYEDNVEIIEKGKAFIQPLRYKKSGFENEFLNPGYVDKSRCVYIGDPSLRLDTKPLESIIICNGSKYVIKSAKSILVKDKIIYIWAILQNAYTGD